MPPSASVLNVFHMLPSVASRDVDVPAEPLAVPRTYRRRVRVGCRSFRSGSARPCTVRSAVAGVFGVMMDRRVFLKLTGLVAAASALEALPVAAEGRPGAAPAERAHDLQVASGTSGTRLTIREPGTYRISGRVRLEEPLVEISGIADTQ